MLQQSKPSPPAEPPPPPPPPDGSRTNSLPSSLKFDKLKVADLQVVSLLKQMHLSRRCLEVKDYRQHKNKIYALSRDPGVGLMKAFSSSNAEKQQQIN